ncbi:HDOD domain-containing protein [Parachitinimonas caeni]|uniref:HDOD domain-containing protein n=1 Tax=Parachitinimonas caeni TaxID=3031301 RepID=A0ABT7DW19_9NEIS|nr:HDOD domain-containing protein [Parachitinimonas caeni]MDK2124184.1 HDOD domain-containing protein [Parachitinimonas caeni]
MLRQISENEAQNLLKSLTIPARPQILADLAAEQARPAADLRKVAELISQDVSLAAAVLKIANSSAFARGQVSTIPEAATYLGLTNLGNVVASVSLRKALPKPHNFDIGQFWTHTLGIAALAALAASQFRLCSADQAHLFGLLRDSGMPVLAQRFSHYGKTLQQGAEQPDNLPALEEAIHRVGHDVVGYLLARSWNLPVTLQQAILHHHAFSLLQTEDASLEPQALTLIALARLAEHLVITRSKLSRDPGWSAVGGIVVGYLGLHSDDIEHLAEEASQLESVME